MHASKPKKMNLEAAFKELEDLVRKMESQQLPLEESLKCFEQGVKLVSQCQKELRCAEQKIQKLVSQNAPFELTDFSQNQQGSEIEIT